MASLIVLAPMLIGTLVRPKLPTDEKDAVYECGEPTIGSSFIQFDLRFYTVALLFIVFDVVQVIHRRRRAVLVLFLVRSSAAVLGGVEVRPRGERRG